MDPNQNYQDGGRRDDKDNDQLFDLLNFSPTTADGNNGINTFEAAFGGPGADPNSTTTTSGIQITPTTYSPQQFLTPAQQQQMFVLQQQQQQQHHAQAQAQQVQQVQQQAQQMEAARLYQQTRMLEQQQELSQIQQQFPQLLANPSMNMESPISDITSPVEMFTNLNLHQQQSHHSQHTPQLASSYSNNSASHHSVEQILDPSMEFMNSNKSPTNTSQISNQPPAAAGIPYSPHQYIPAPPPAPIETHAPPLPQQASMSSSTDQSLPVSNSNFYSSAASTDHLVPSSNTGFYSNMSNNHSNSNLTIISTHSYVSANAEPPSSHADQHNHHQGQHSHNQDISAADLLSPYESTAYVSLSPSHSAVSSRPNSPFLTASPFSNNDMMYQNIESLNIDGDDHLSGGGGGGPIVPAELELTANEKAAIAQEFQEQESKINVPQIIQSSSDDNNNNNDNNNTTSVKLTEDNLNNNNTILTTQENVVSTPIQINIQAPEDIAAKTPSLFSNSNSQRSTPINSPRQRPRSNSSEHKSSTRPDITVKQESGSSNDVDDMIGHDGVKQEEEFEDDNDNLLKPGDDEFRRMRNGRRLSNASSRSVSRSHSRSRSRSRSRSSAAAVSNDDGDSSSSKKSDYSDPSKNREKMIELAAPHSNKRTQKHPSVHACHLCDKTFTRPYNLKSHLRTHTDERPFICSTCGKAFARQHDKKRHEDLHTGEKRFQCKGLLYDGKTEWGCGKRFARADALGRHFKTESGKNCVRPLLEDHLRKKSISAGMDLSAVEQNSQVTDDMLNKFDFNELFEHIEKGM